MDWTKQGAAVVSSVEFTTGQRGKVVIVGPRENPKGAVIVIAGPAGVETRSVGEYLDRLNPAAVAEILCMQERAFGASGLPKVQLP
ncbi:MAG: hypothetical protein HUU46_17645 [Candidatus Hydrogenedentes bacterium]|nr:hypothetical protein [Candidatus Hydrogenedentota bacterium]